jgi:hypothetical protein
MTVFARAISNRISLEKQTPPGGGAVVRCRWLLAAQLLRTNSDFKLIAPKPSILQSMS